MVSYVSEDNPETRCSVNQNLVLFGLRCVSTLYFWDLVEAFLNSAFMLQRLARGSSYHHSTILQA